MAEGDEVPSAVVPAAIPYFLIRLTAVCIERRELGVVREFALRALATGLETSSDLSGFLGIDQQEMDLELDAMQSEMFIGKLASGGYRLLEKGKLAISRSGLPRVVEREAACYVNGITRRIEQSVGELSAKRRLPGSALILPSVPSRPPNVNELDLAGVRSSMLLARTALPRLLEVSRLGRVIRASNLFAHGHLMVRKGAHAVPLVCIDGAADSDLARGLGAHPALEALKTCMERHEKQVRHSLGQISPKVRGAKHAHQESVRRAIATCVAYVHAEAEAEAEAVANFKAAFLSVVKEMVQATHWATSLEFEVLLVALLLMAKDRLLIVAPSIVELLGLSRGALMQDAVRRGVKIELYLPSSQLQLLDRRQDLRSSLVGVQVEELKSIGDWFGFCCDQMYTVIGTSRPESTSMGRFDYAFGAFIVDESEKLLRDTAIKFGAAVVIKPKRRRLS
ncbi:hypothetical protein ABIC63_004413 [Pseudacidovorax sp. 1753]|uniref:hypothetical protein n=1 Tax=Pseudacidovorax sp. 1753 TaxID=3156419 RepID=UPI003396F089